MFSRRLLAVAVITPLLAVAVPSPMAGVQCPEEWTEPVACALEVTVEREDAPDRTVGAKSTIRVRPGERFDLLVTARDQEGALFPSDRMAYRWETESRCRSLVSLDEHGVGHVEVEARSRAGSCDLRLWVPGNLNLERRIRIEIAAETVTETDLRDLARSHPEEAARSMYQAILGRSPDREGLRNSTEKIRRGGIEEEVRKMCGSREYASRLRSVGTEEQIRDIFHGLLDREPGESGMRHYLELLRRGGCAEVVLGIMRSTEFESHLREEEHDGHRHDHR